MGNRRLLLERIAVGGIECDLFNNFPYTDVQSVARYFNISEIEEGGVIFQEGDIGSFMGIINEGNVSVLKSDLEESNVPG